MAKGHVVAHGIRGVELGQRARDLPSRDEIIHRPAREPEVPSDTTDMGIYGDDQTRRIEPRRKMAPRTEVEAIRPPNHPAKVKEQALRSPAGRRVGEEIAKAVGERAVDGAPDLAHEARGRVRVVDVLGAPGPREGRREAPVLEANAAEGLEEPRDILPSLKPIDEAVQAAERASTRTRRQREPLCGRGPKGSERHPGARPDTQRPPIRETRDEETGDLLVMGVSIRMNELHRVGGAEGSAIHLAEQRLESTAHLADGRRTADLAPVVSVRGHGLWSDRGDGTYVRRSHRGDMGIRVFVVEDQPKILKSQIKLLQEFDDIEIVGEALSGESALEKIPEVHPEVLLLDLGLPQMSGIDVTRRVKGQWPEIEVLIFTIFDEEEKVTEAILAGAAGYLLKGTPVEKIVEALRDVKAGGAVIQPNLARALLRLIGKSDRRAQPADGRADKRADRSALAGDAGRAAPPTGDAAKGAGQAGDAASLLTDRELEILQIIAKGLSNNEAAKVLGLSKATIRTHLEHIYEKLDVTNRVEAVTEGIRQGIINL